MMPPDAANAGDPCRLRCACCPVECASAPACLNYFNYDNILSFYFRIMCYFAFLIINHTLYYENCKRICGFFAGENMQFVGIRAGRSGEDGLPRPRCGLAMTRDLLRSVDSCVGTASLRSFRASAHTGVGIRVPHASPAGGGGRAARGADRRVSGTALCLRRMEARSLSRLTATAPFSKGSHVCFNLFTARKEEKTSSFLLPKRLLCKSAKFWQRFYRKSDKVFSGKRL